MGGFKEEIREPGEAERPFRLMDIDGICHSAFCGRLEARFPGRAILYTTCPGLGLAKPDKSRLFSLLTVHSRPPFPFTFCFLPPVNSGGTAGAVFCPVGFGDEHTAADLTAFQVLIPENLRFQRPRPAARPPSGTTLQQTEKEIVCGTVQVSPSSRDNAVAVLTATALPAYQAGRLFSLRRGHAVKGTVPACVPAAASLYRGYLSCVPSILLSVAVLPEKVFLPHSCGVFRRWHAPRNFGTFCPRSPTPCGASPAWVFLFGRSFCFQGAVHR